MFSEGLEAKIPELLKQFPNMPPQEASDLIWKIAEADPTEQKAYTPWLIRQVRKNHVRLPEDQDRVLNALRSFDQNKRIATFPGPKDINAYKTFPDLETIIDRLSGQELKSKRQTKREVKEDGARLVYDDGTYAIIEIIKPEAAVIYSKGSKWCTSNANTAAHYLNKGPIHIILKDDQKIAQLHTATQQFMDLTDRPYDYTSDPGLRKALASVIKPTDPNTAFFMAKIVGRRIPEYESAIAKNANLALQYAENVIGGRWPEAEPTIANDPRVAYQYAQRIIKGRWEEAEKWMGVQELSSAVKYASSILKKRWPRLEEALLQIDTKNSYDLTYLIEYADNIIKGRWPEAEPLIATNLHYAINYASKHIKGPWPEIEQAIMRAGASTIFEYINEVLKGPWPRLEKAILKAVNKLPPKSEEWRDVAKLGFKYSRDAKGGSWPEFEQLLVADPDFYELYKNNISLGRRT